MNAAVHTVLITCDAAARHFTDLDILVYPADTPRALEVLEGAGWRRGIDMYIGPMKSIMRAECELQLVEPGKGTFLEVHWALQPPAMRSSLDVDALWKRAYPLPLLGRSLPCPGPADSFIGLAVHAAQHEWLNLEQACSLGALVVTHPEMDWAAVVEQSWLFGCHRRCLLGATVVHESLAIPLPDDMLRAARSDRGVRRLAARVYERWNAGVAPEPSLWARGAPNSKRAEPVRAFDPHLGGTAREIAWTAGTFDRRGQGTRYALRLVFGAQLSDRMAFALPGPLEPLYVGLRPARLAWKHGLRVLRRRATEGR